VSDYQIQTDSNLNPSIFNKFLPAISDMTLSVSLHSDNLQAAAASHEFQ